MIVISAFKSGALLFRRSATISSDRRGQMAAMSLKWNSVDL